MILDSERSVENLNQTIKFLLKMTHFSRIETRFLNSSFASEFNNSTSENWNEEKVFKEKPESLKKTLLTAAIQKFRHHLKIIIK